MTGSTASYPLLLALSLSLLPRRMQLDSCDSSEGEGEGKPAFTLRFRLSAERFVAQLVQRECSASALNHYALADRGAPSRIVIFPVFSLLKIFRHGDVMSLFFFRSFLSHRDEIELLLKLLSSIPVSKHEKKWCLDIT